MFPLIRRSPLERFKTGQQFAEIRFDDLLVQERPHSGMFLLRVRGSEQSASSNLQQALKIDLPLVPNTVNGVDPRAVWIGPHKWMIVCEDTEVEKLCHRIRQALANTVNVVSDCSDARIVIRIIGRLARALFSKSCALDLTPDHFAPGQCAQTLFARIPVLIHQIDSSPSFDLYVDTSLSVYAWQWLLDASNEYSLPRGTATSLRTNR